MRRTVLVGALTVASAGALMGVVTPPASAAYKVQAHVSTPGADDNSGGTASANITLRGARTATYANIYYNDTCDSDGKGDGYEAWARAFARTTNGNATGQWYVDRRGCGQQGITVSGPRDLSTSANITAAGIQVCLVYRNPDTGTTRQIRCAEDF